jgi:hypothetical protein
MSQTDTETEALTPTDKAALELAIEVTRKESPARRKQVDSFLATRPWFAVAKFCASCAQDRALRLMPWQHCPSHVDDIAAVLKVTDDIHGWRAAALLLQRMLAAGVSRWHPNPVAACEAAEKNQPAK